MTFEFNVSATQPITFNLTRNIIELDLQTSWIAKFSKCFYTWLIIGALNLVATKLPIFVESSILHRGLLLINLVAPTPYNGQHSYTKGVWQGGFFFFNSYMYFILVLVSLNIT